MTRCSVVVPAYNEEPRIGSVLRVLQASPRAAEIVVVSDASGDRTAEVARSFGVQVLELPYNTGKGGAMMAGLVATTSPYVLFLDADLIGLQGEHVDALLTPLEEGRFDMMIGVFRGGRFWSTTAQRVAPFLSGQRAARREIFESWPWLAEMRMGVEMAMTNAAREAGLRVRYTPLYGVSNPPKEAKIGIVRGVAARTRMYAEILRAAGRSA